MFIQTEATQDSDVIKFFPGQIVLAEGQAEFPDADAAARSPLALRLFDVEGVTAVSLDRDNVTVAKDTETEWSLLKPAVLGAIMDHFVAGQPVMDDEDRPVRGAEGANSDTAPETDGEYERIVAEIEGLIEERILPAVTQNGGGVSLHSFKDATAYLELSGGAVSMLQPISNMLSHYIPEVSAARDYRDALPKPGLETEVGQAVARVLDQRINPSVASHGGHIALVDVVDEEKVYIRLEGGCQGCGMADVTLKQGVEVEIMNAVPQISQVLDVTDHEGGSNPYYQPGKG